MGSCPRVIEWLSQSQADVAGAETGTQLESITSCVPVSSPPANEVIVSRVITERRMALNAPSLVHCEIPSGAPISTPTQNSESAVWFYGEVCCSRLFLSGRG